MFHELAWHNKFLANLSFASDTGAELRILPMGHEDLFQGRLDEASKQAEGRGHRRHELEVSFKVPQVQTGVSSALAPTYTCQASDQRSSQSSRSRSEDKSKKGKGLGHGKASPSVTVTSDNPEAQTVGQSNK